MGSGPSKHEREANRYREESERQKEELRQLRDAQRKLEDEKRDLELKSARAEYAEKEADLRRVNEELEQLKETRRLKEELQQSQEKAKRMEEKLKMDNLARKIEDEARERVEKEIWLRKEAENNLAEGIPPVKYPTGAEIQAIRDSLGYQDGYLHIAITGCSGSGKSSLVNAVRGYKNSNAGFLKSALNTFLPDQNIAKTGTSETTTAIKRYPDPHHSRKTLAWYDVPGAGTINVRDWQYFNNQGLYIFDIIMIAVGDRITSTDVDLLFHCKRFGIPTYFVRSKADQHIRNCMEDNEVSEDDARSVYIDETRNTFSATLTQVGLPQQGIYIVRKETLRLLNDGKKPKSRESIIDEEELIRDITDALQKWTSGVPDK